MKVRSRLDRRTDWSALALFGIVYLAALVVVVAPDSFRATSSHVTAASTLFPVSKGEP